ncbi:MAG: hypothetical protein HKP58_10025, partial [Desulfatitalea sp.]|nr:hypothetical protein [Desulfatitalea sp.]NNK00738.1 hypothetical protein [Desulfatitalea sp.]
MSNARTLLDYHQATKHHFHRYARSAGHMDWRNQPHPFRVYEGAPSLSLPTTATPPDLTYAALFGPPGHPARALNRSTLSDFLLHALALSAWKATGGSRWSLRVNPSSGNLHPTESYLVLPKLPDMPTGVYHY